MTLIDITSKDKIRVLVVEDRENWRNTFCALLEDIGYKPIQATCGDEFEEKALGTDVVVLDISMPKSVGDRESETTGLDVLLRLQKRYPDHMGIQHPIVRSMWDREEFRDTQYANAKVDDNYWVSRNMPSASLLNLIEKIVSMLPGGGG